MIAYDEDTWAIKLICRWTGGLTFRALWFAVPSMIMSIALGNLDLYWEEADEKIHALRNATLARSQIWSAATAFLIALIFFRANQAMKRFWEATSLLHQMRGEWFDSVSCCVTFSRFAPKEKESDSQSFRHTLVRLMSLCHGCALNEISAKCAEPQVTVDMSGLDKQTLSYIFDSRYNMVETVLHLIQVLITKNFNEGVMCVPPPIMSRVYQTLSRGFVHVLNAKKISDTKFPYPLVQLITICLLLETLFVPMLMLAITQDKVWAPVLTFFTIFSFAFLNYGVAQLEDPFGEDANDLPMHHFQEEMNRCMLMFLEEKAPPHPRINKKKCVTSIGELALHVDTLDASQSSSPAERRTRVPSKTAVALKNSMQDFVEGEEEEDAIVQVESSEEIPMPTRQERPTVSFRSSLVDQGEPIASPASKWASQMAGSDDDEPCVMPTMTDIFGPSSRTPSAPSRQTAVSGVAPSFAPGAQRRSRATKRVETGVEKLSPEAMDIRSMIGNRDPGQGDRSEEPPRATAFGTGAEALGLGTDIASVLPELDGCFAASHTRCGKLLLAQR